MKFSPLFRPAAIALLVVLAACSGKDEYEPSILGEDGQEASVAAQMGPVGDPNMPVSAYPVDPMAGMTAMNAIPGTQDELRQRVGDTVQFGFDRAELTPEARAILDGQVSWLKRYSNLRVTVSGHADERGTREYNLALGERRANAVRNYLIAMGIEPSRVSVISYGKERPVAVGSDAESWSMNRRAVTQVD